jgi:hypothetical protein
MIMQFSSMVLTPKSSQLLRCVGFATGCAGILQHGTGIHESKMESDLQQDLDLVFGRRRDDSDEMRRGDDAATSSRGG